MNVANARNTNLIDDSVLSQVLEDLKNGHAFPTLESAYQRAIGNFKDRAVLLHLLAEQESEQTLFSDEIGRIVLKASREVAEQLDVKFVDQLMPRLVEKKFGPVLERVAERQGTYEFVNPVLRQCIKLRKIDWPINQPGRSKRHAKTHAVSGNSGLTTIGAITRGASTRDRVTTTIRKST